MIISCPNCGAALELPDESVGTKVKAKQEANGDGKQGELGFDDGMPSQSDVESETAELNVAEVLRKYYKYPCYRDDTDCVAAWKAFRDDREVVNALGEVVDDFDEALAALERDSSLSPTEKKIKSGFYRKVIGAARDELAKANYKAVGSLTTLDVAMRAYDGE